MTEPIAEIDTAARSVVTPGRFGANLTASLANFVVSVAAGIWFTSYLVGHLGIAAYGLIPLMATVVSCLSLVTLGLNSAVGRYILVSLERGDVRAATSFFNTSLVGSVLLVAVLTVPGFWIASYAGFLFRLPAGHERDAIVLFRFTIAAFLVTALTAPFEVSSFCRNRFDLRTAVQVTSTLARLGLVCLLFTLTTPRVWHAGLAALSAAVASLIGAAWIWRRLTPQLRFAPGSFRWRSLAEMTSTGGWIVINQLGTLLYLSLDLLIINRLLGAEAGGHYAAVMQWSVLLRAMAAAIGVLFAPTIFALYARRDTAGLVSYSRRAVKLLGLGMALPIGLICGLSRPLLAVWLGPDYVPLAPLLALMTFHLCINLSVLPLFNLQVATNRVRWPGLVTCAMGAANVALAVALAGPAHWGLYGVAAAGAIMLTLKNAVFTPLYGAHLLRKPPFTFLREIALACLATAVLALLAWRLSFLWEMASWTRLATAGAVLALLYGTVLFAFTLRPEERAVVLRMLPFTRARSEVA